MLLVSWLARFAPRSVARFHHNNWTNPKSARRCAAPRRRGARTCGIEATEALEIRTVLSPFIPGSIDGQDGWSGGTIAISPTVDQAVEQTGVAHTGVGAWRVSNKAYNGNFNGWPFSPNLTVAAGQPSSGAGADQFTATVWFKAASETADGSNMELDLGTFAGNDRNTFVAVTNDTDDDGGLKLRIGEPQPGSGGNFYPTLIPVTNLSRTDWHRLDIVAKFNDGPSNDTFEIFLNGTAVVNDRTGGTTWLTFEAFRDDLGSPYEQTGRLFWRSGAAANAYDPSFVNANAAGFYFDDVSYFASNQSTPDVVLASYGATFEPAGMEPLTVYVDDSWANLSFGTDPDGAGPATVLGIDAFASIQAAADAVADGGTIYVAAGIYRENVTLEKSVTVLGPNESINPNDGMRLEEAVVVPATVETSLQASTSGTVFRVGNSGGPITVTIKGLTIDGHNDQLTGGRTLNGVEIHTGAAIINSVGSFDNVPNAFSATLIVQNNVIQNFERYGVFIDNIASAPAVAGNDVSFNRIDNIPSGDTFTGDRGRGIAFGPNIYGSVTHNTITRVNVGWQHDNHYRADPTGVGTLVDSNTISTYHRGIFHNLQYSEATVTTISNNTISAETTGASATNFGIMLSSIQQTVGARVLDNTISGNVYGIVVWNTNSTGDIEISGGTISDTSYGIWVTNNDNQFGAASGTQVTISGVTIENSEIAGVFVEDADSVVDATVRLSLSNSEITGTAGKGVLVSGFDGTATLTLENSLVNGFATGVDVMGSVGAITLRQNSLSGNTTFIATTGAPIDASFNWFGVTDEAAIAAGITGLASVDVSPYLGSGDAETATLGFQPNLSTLFVTAQGTQSGMSGRIQEAIDALVAGGTITVGAGDFAESLVIAQNLTLSGAGAGTTNLLATGDAVTVSGAGNVVALAGLTIQGATNALVAADLASLSLSDVQSSGNTSGGSITSVATVSITASAGDNAITASATQVELTGLQPLALSGVATLNLSGNSGADTFAITPASTMAIHVDGLAPTTNPGGDSLAVDLTAGTNPAQEINGIGAGAFTADNLATLTYAGIESVSATYPPNVAGPVVVDAGTADNVADTFRIVQNGTNLEIYVNGALSSSTPLANVTSVTINGSTDDDTLDVDFSGGTFILPITFNGNGGDENTLLLTGGTFATVTYDYLNATDGSVTLESGVASQVITYVGLSPIISTGTVADVIFNLPAGGTTAFLEDDGTIGNGSIRLRSGDGTFELTTIASPTSSLTINGGAGADNLTLQGLDDLNASLIVAFDIADDSIAIPAALSLGSNPVSASLSLTAEAITLGGNLMATGDIALVAKGAFTVDNTITSTGGSVGIRLVDSTAAGDDLVVAATGAISASTTVTLEAGDNLTLAAGSSITAGGLITLAGDVDNLDATPGTVMDVQGTLNGVAAVVRGGAGADLFLITPSGSTPIAVQGGAPTAAPGDRLFVRATGTGSVSRISSGPNSGSYNFQFRVSVTFAGIELAQSATRQYHLFNPNANLDFFTPDFNEYTALLEIGLVDKSTGNASFSVSPAQSAGQLPVFRLYNPVGGGHELTLDTNERDFLISVGWRLEPSVGFLYPTQVAGTVEIFRLYNSLTGGHFFTADVAERDALLALEGWVQHASLGFGFVSPVSEAPASSDPESAPATSAGATAELATATSGSSVSAFAISAQATSTEDPVTEEDSVNPSAAALAGTTVQFGTTTVVEPNGNTADETEDETDDLTFADPDELDDFWSDITAEFDDLLATP